MPDLGKAYVQIVPSAEGISGSISNVLSGEASSAGNEAGGLLSDGMVTALKAGLAAAGVGAIVSTAIGKVGDFAQLGDAIDKNSQKMGISAKAYQEWDAVLQHSGTSIESVKSSFKTLANAAQDGNDAFEKIGLSMEEVQAMSTEDLFGAVINGLQGMEEGTERAALANDLLGRGAMEMGALLNTSAEDTQAMRDRVSELGGVLSDEAVKGAAAYQDSLQDMQTALKSVANGLLSEFLPGFTQVMNGITALFSGDSESGIGLIRDGLTGIVGTITEAVPRLIEGGAQLVTGVLQGISDNLPELLATGGQMALSALDGFLADLPQMMEAGFQALSSLVQGIVNNLPALITQGAALVAALASTIASHLPEILQKGIELLGQLLAGIIQAIPQIPGAIMQIINSIKGEFEKFNWLEIGTNIIKGIANGISGAAKLIRDAAMEAARQAFNAVKSFFGIESPSKLMRDEIGAFIPAGIAAGIIGNEDMVTDAMDSLSAKATGTITANVSGTMGRYATQTANTAPGSPVTINVYQRDGEDSVALARRVADLVNNDVARRKAVFA